MTSVVTETKQERKQLLLPANVTLTGGSLGTSLIGLSSFPQININSLPKGLNISTIAPFKPVVAKQANVNLNAANNKYKELFQKTKQTEELLPNLKIFGLLIKYSSFKELKDETGNIVIDRELKLSNSAAEIQTGNMLIGTVKDHRMGVFSDEANCATCNKTVASCPGHPGRIELAKAIFNPEALPYIIKIMKCMCLTCGSLLLTKEDLTRKGVLRKTYRARLDAFVDAVKGVRCKSPGNECLQNPTISAQETKKTNSGKIFAKNKKTDPGFITYTAKEILSLFEKLSEEDVALLGFENGATPVNLIMKGLYVIPTISRPPAIRDGQVIQHDLTMMYDDIVKNNNLLKEKMKNNSTYEKRLSDIDTEKRRYERYIRSTPEEQKAIRGRIEDQLRILSGPERINLQNELSGYTNPQVTINKLNDQYNKITQERSQENIHSSTKEKTEDQLYDELYTKIQHLMNNTDGTYTKNGNKQYKGIKELINGKEELVRGLLMGKRVNFAARTVLSPDPSLKLGQIRIPKIWESILTVPVRIFNSNLEYVRELYDARRIGFITKSEGPDAGVRRAITDKNFRDITPESRDVVERYMENGDIVIFNRQPTIQKESEMGYEVVLSEEKTIGLHPSVCKAHNADNDGDEGNVHQMQTIAAIVETHRLINVKQCIMNGQSNRNMLNVHMDPVQAAYMLTRDKTKIIDEDVYVDCLDIITEKSDFDTLSARCNKYGVMPKSGQGMFSALFPADFFYSKGNVRILEGVMTTGIITNDHLGTSSGSLTEAMYKQTGTTRTVAFITDANFMLNRYALEIPFSVKYSDCVVEDIEHRNMVNERITSAKIAVNEIERKRELRQTRERMLGRKSNDLETEREEKEIISVLNTTRNVGARTAEKYLGPNNGLNISISSKVKGDVYNISQIIDIVGQQFINSKRLPKAITRGTRCSPYFAPGDTSIESQGFCTGNFFDGLSPAEQFFLQTGGRENTVESTVKVPTSGDINHRMVKNYEDITLQNNGNVCNSRDRIIQFAYEDGFSSYESVPVETRQGKILSFVNLKVLADKLNVKYGYNAVNIK